MNFRFMALKNLKSNVQKYAAYLLSSSFCIMTFFMFTTVLLNEDIVKSRNYIPIEFILGIATSVFINFAIFFIAYAYNSFIKSRTEEFGMLLTLGMTNSELYYMILIENVVLILIALAAGLFSGTIFSRVFFLTIVKFSKLEGVHYSLRFRNYAASVMFFLMISIILNIYLILRIRKLQVKQLIEENNKPYIIKNYYNLAGIIGLIIISGTFITLYVLKISGNPYFYIINKGVLYLIVLGLYLVILGFGGVYQYLARKKRSTYVYNMLGRERVTYRFSKNRNIIFLLSFFGFAIIYYTGYGYSLNDRKAFINKQYPYDIIYIQDNSFSKDLDDKLVNIAESGSTPVTSEKSLEYISVDAQVTMKYNDKEKLVENLAIVPITKYNEFSHLNLKLKGGTPLLLSNETRFQKIHGKVLNRIELNLGGRTYEYNVANQTYKLLLEDQTNMPDTILILSDESYASLADNNSDAQIKTLMAFNYKEWDKTGNIVNRLKQELSQYGSNVISKYDLYTVNNQEAMVSVFIFCFIEILLFIISSSLLYFNMLLEMDGIKKSYSMLFRLGITDDEMKKIIKQELASVFFIPLFISSMMAYTYVWIITLREPLRPQYLSNTFNTIVVYFSLYFIYYQVTKGKYVKEVLYSEGH